MKSIKKQKNIYKIETYNTVGRAQIFNSNWKFSNAVSSQKCKQTSFNDSDFELLNLPHDWSIYYDFNHESKAQNEAGLLDGGEAWYRKQFIIDKSLIDKEFIIRFGGVYMDSNLYINGKFVGNMPSGYTPFSYNITQFLYTDGRINTLAMHVVNEQPSSRWYSGSGIYRDVHLDIVDPLHMLKEDIVIDYQNNKDHFITSIKSKLSKTTQEVDLLVTISEKNGAILYEGKQAWNHTIEVKHEIPKLWSVDKPHLYHLNLQLISLDQIIDQVTIQFGYRFLNWTSDEGFFLNGVPTKFHGVCLHHDNGALGACAHYDALKRKLSIMKEMGVNAIRSSHNPCDDKTIKIAEEIGLMVIDESFDTWYWGKKKYDYGRFFELEATHPDAQANQTWAEFDLKAMVKRGINSPAIIMWSIGNEIGESNDGSHKAIETVKKLNKWVKEIDKTRYTTMGQDVYRWAATGPHENISEVVDAVGLNYAEDSFDTIRANHPEWLIYGSETSSGTRSRGEYAYPDETRSHDNHDNRNYQQSDYGNDHVAWGKTVEQCWLFDKSRKDYAGQFFWTGFDYIGEPTPWHNQNQTPATSSYFGIVDTAGLPKNDFYLLQSQWTKEPMIHIYPHWNWDNVENNSLMKTKDHKIPIRVVSNQPYVELFLNDQSLGIKTQAEDEVYREWRLDFEPGSLTAIGYNNQQIETCRKSIRTAKQAKKIVIEKDKNSGCHLDYLIISTRDEHNNFVPIAQNNIHFEIFGDAKIIGVDNGNPASMERYQAQLDKSWSRKLFNGYALVIIEKSSNHVYYELKVTSDGLLPALYQTQDKSLRHNDLEVKFDVDKNKLIKHHRAPYTLSVNYKGQDLDINFVDYILKYDNAILSIDEQYIYCHQDNNTEIIIDFPHYTMSHIIPIKIKDSCEPRFIKCVHTYPLIVEKDLPLRNTYPIRVDFDNGYTSIFNFSILSKVDTSKNNKFTAEAFIQDLDYRFKIDVMVESYLVAEKFSTAKFKNGLPQLPEKAHVYHSDGSRQYKDVTWESSNGKLIVGHISDTNIQTSMSIRETTKRIDGRNIAQIWTGSQLPIAFADKPSNRSVSRINNGNFEREAVYHTHEYVGIIFGDSGDFTLEYVDNCVLYLNSVESMTDISVEYLDALPSGLPHDMEAVDVIDNLLWKPFEINDIRYDIHSVRIELEGAMASAIKIKAPNSDLFQVAVIEAIPEVFNNANFIIKNGTQTIDSRKEWDTSYTYQGSLDIEVFDNGSYAVIEYPDEIIVNIKAEAQTHGLNLRFIK